MSKKISKWVSHRKRASKLAGMTVSVASKYAGNRIKSAFSNQPHSDEAKADFYRHIGKQVVSTLGELKGAAMKVGQMASQMQHLFPKEFADELAALQNQAPPMDFSVLERQIILELGDYPDNLFAKFDKTPMAAASIGQVHRAVTHDGKDVVMKIQYPGIEKACKSDLKHLRRLLKLGGLIKVDPDALEAVFDELSETLIRELDYIEEAKQLTRFYEFHKMDDDIIIPEVIPELSTKTILTTTLEQGDSIKQVLSKGYSQQAKNQIGEQLFQFFGRQVFEFDGFHSDPHPGNFAFRPDGKVIIYDFGSISPVSEDLKQNFYQFLKASIDRNYKALDQSLIQLKVRSSTDTRIPDDFYALWSEIFMTPFDQDTPFDFGSSNIHKRAIKEWKTFLPYWKDFQPSPDTVFINRVIGGVYLLLVEMGCQCQLQEPLNEFLKLEHLQNKTEITT
ncbi:AarF/ABC1/UbiB kinase family protein [Litoribacillus peritrichatus]|uniref:AarF/ABC1/UbiB kinase family protein n=1 Tax=Litoribacillus peritrichatus TaxID=718191 RepID=A0ABP7N251_9GAMM